jgi:TolB protein
MTKNVYVLLLTFIAACSTSNHLLDNGVEIRSTIELLSEPAATVSPPTTPITPKPVSTVSTQFFSPTPTMIGNLSGRLVFASSENGNGGSNIFILDLKTREVQRLTYGGGGSGWEPNNVSPDWSPSGDEIVFASDRGNEFGELDLFKINLKSGEITRLTRTQSWERWPDWSPDGERIVFISDTNSGLGDRYIEIINSNGLGRERLSEDPVSIRSYPKWDPSGEHIAYVCESETTLAPIICIQEVDSRTVTQLDEVYKAYGDLAWSLDGSSIIYVGSTSDQNMGIVEISLIDYSISVIREISGGIYSPSWSPDSQLIAYSSGGANENEIFIIYADGSGLLQITQNQADDWGLDWIE